MLPSGAWATRPPLHRSDLEEGRPLKIISNNKENIEMKKHQLLHKIQN